MPILKPVLSFAVVCFAASGCFQQLVPADPSQSAVGFGRDNGVFNEWNVATSEFRLDGAPIPWTSLQQMQIPPGRHTVSFQWEIQSEGDSNDRGFTLLTTKAGTCDLSIDAAAGRGYLIGAEVQGGGSWVSDPQVNAVVRDGKSSDVLQVRPCVYRRRGLAPAIM